jgi:hypothetical protein
MAGSPSHKFGQDLGNLLEYVVLYKVLKPRLEVFAAKNNFFLDWQTDRPARAGKKLSWRDQYGNSHDLDFVIEAGGTPEKIGTPVAFIEAAWRRYTKHSKNKAQEIQGAILPIVEMHKLSAPFYGAVLAGEFSDASLRQLRNNKFSVLYIPYNNVVGAFRSVGFDIAFDEATADANYVAANSKLAALSEADMDAIRNALVEVSKNEIDQFMVALQAALERVIAQIILVPMFGTEFKSPSIELALKALEGLNLTIATGALQKIEVIVDYSNGDSIRASFHTATAVSDFLTSLRR